MAMFDLAYARQQADGSCCGSRTPTARFSPTSEPAALRHAALARPHLGRGARHRWPRRAVPPVGAARHLPFICGPAPRGGQGLSLLVLSRAARADARGAAARQAADGVRPTLPRAHPGRTSGMRASRPNRWSGCVPEDVELEFDDLIMGRTRAPHPDDQVILKADGFPTPPRRRRRRPRDGDHPCRARSGSRRRQLPVALPLVRGGAPKFAHMPLLRDEKKAKISEAQEPVGPAHVVQGAGLPARGAGELLALQGYPPILEADGTEREVFTFAEFTERFRWEDVNRAGAIFNLDKLDWLNGVYIRFRGARLHVAAAAVPEADGVLSGSPSLGELGRLMAVAELIQTRIESSRRPPRWSGRSSSATTRSRSPTTPGPS